jgi:hypothetical protein
MKILYVIGSRLMSGCEDHLLDIAVWFRAQGVEPWHKQKKRDAVIVHTAELTSDTWELL